jgi:serine/threonine protein kinase
MCDTTYSSSQCAAVISKLNSMKVVAETSRTKVYVSKKLAYKFITKASVSNWWIGDDERIPLEIYLLLKLKNCAKICQIVTYFETANEWCIVMRKPKDCLTLWALPKLNEYTTKRFIIQIIEAIQNCYARKICHGDLKSENILIDAKTGDIVLVDFGSALFFDPKRRYKCFTGTFYPPEYLRGGDYRDEPYSVFCIGILTLELLTQLDLYNYNNKGKSLLKILRRFRVSASCEHFIKQCLMDDENCRPALSALMIHPWLKIKK